MNFEVKIHKTGDGHFQTKYRDLKTGKRVRKRFPSQKEAKSFKFEVENKINSKGANSLSDIRVSQSLKFFLEKYPASKIRSRKNHFTSFVEKFGVYKVTEVSISDLESWMAKQKAATNLSDRTMNAVKTQFYQFFEYLVNEEYIPKNPLKKIRFKRFDIPRRKRVILSVEEMHTVLANVKMFSPTVLFPYLSCAAHTGARRSEIMKLNRTDIDFATGLIHFRETKNGRERFVRISPTLAEVLKNHMNSHNETALILNEDGIRVGRSALTRLINKFKVFFPMEKNWGSHSFRHSFAYNFLKKGGRMYQLQAILGHRSIDVTVDLYGQLQAQDIECPSPFEQPQEKL